MDADEALANPRHEKYCRERVAGKTQRQAMLAAWPDLSRWKPETVDNKAYKLEVKVRSRLGLPATSASPRKEPRQREPRC